MGSIVRRRLILPAVIIALTVALAAPRIAGIFFGAPIGERFWGYFSYFAALAGITAALVTLLLCVLLITRCRRVIVIAGIAALMTCELAIRIAEVLTNANFGIGFDPEFFYHFEWESVRVALIWFWVPFAFLSAGFVLLLLSLRWLVNSACVEEGYLNSLACGAVLLLVGASSYLPNAIKYVSILNFSLSAARFYEGTTPYRNLSFSPAEVENIKRKLSNHGPRPSIGVEPKEHYNVVIVFVESLQADLVGTRNEQLKSLTPFLSSFAEEYIHLQNYYSSANSTVSGLASGYCGFVALADSPRDYSRPLSAKCVPALYKEAGYQTSFYMGGTKGYGSKAVLLNNAGFSRIIGREEILHSHPDRKFSLNPWGIHDTDLVNVLLSDIDSNALPAPFFASLLTLSMHTPGFSAPDCEIAKGKNSLMQGIFCTDQALARLFEGLRLRGLLDRTILVITADHHYHFSSVHDERYQSLTLRPSEQERHRIYGAAYIPGVGRHPISQTLQLADLPLLLRGGLQDGGAELVDATGRRSLISSDYEISPDGGAVFQTIRECAVENLLKTSVGNGRLWSTCERRKALWWLQTNGEYRASVGTQ